ncbi:MAG TPA: hypothetical protein VHW95_08070 [Steroidobacteraceae bacterium]|jgi:hypothetical protein|nr:hypothetical protein [Steroidobacteraceae bacterium]
MNWNTLRRTSLYGSLALAVVLATACSNQKDPAQKALDDATAAVNQSLTPDADKYAPKRVTELQGKLAELKSIFDAKNYAGVITAAPDVTMAAKELTRMVAADKDTETKELTAQWTDASAAVPKLLEAVHARVDELGKAKHAPKHVDLATARADLTEADGKWANAKSAYSNGKINDALAGAKEVKEKTEAAAAAIKLGLPQTTAAK